MAEEFAPDDKGGTSRKIIEDSTEVIVRRQEDLNERLRQNKLHQALLASGLSVDEIQQQLRSDFVG